MRRAPPKFNRAESLGPYRFGEPPDVRREQLPLLHTVRDPTGRVAYLIRGGATPAGARILLVHSP